MNRRRAQGSTTRRRILDVATRLFTDQGYDATSIEQVLREAGVSRGSLYHHFPGKERLFEAVVEDVESSVVEQLMAAAAGQRDPVAMLRAGCATWIELSADPRIRRISLIDAPAVLGWHRWRELDAKYGFGLMKGALQAVSDAGSLRGEEVEIIAHLLLAALSEAAMLVARAEDPEQTKSDAIAVLERAINGLLGVTT